MTRQNWRMLGAILVVIALLVVIPVGVLLSSALVPAALGTLLRLGSEADHAGSELVDSNI